MGPSTVADEKASLQRIVQNLEQQFNCMNLEMSLASKRDPVLKEAAVVSELGSEQARLIETKQVLVEGFSTENAQLQVQIANHIQKLQRKRSNQRRLLLVWVLAFVFVLVI